MNSIDKLFLLDAYALIYRAYYAFIKNPRINSKGFNTSAILGFVNTLEEVLKKENPTHIGVAFEDIYKPSELHNFSLYLNGKWYSLTAKPGTYNDNDPIGVLDVTISSNLILDEVLGIKDLRSDKRIDFVGGIRGLGELKKRVDSGEMKVALALYPVSMKQLMDIADTGNIMPPKTTWFEPKLRSGLVIHKLD